ncbi:MAG: Bifunctional NAD(P)H-hydrate repair enzyme Nnr [Chlamydiae bacterium]|nr:Bifunctional NAD(P)H-hydrate repair enzyme Nnr [Chlamydiota bacterium]
MKIVASKQMAFLESQAYRNGCSEEEFMEEAGKGIARNVQEFVSRHNLRETTYLLCGKGNNAGDAYVAGVYLLTQGYSVLAYQIVPIGDCSPLCQKNHDRFLQQGGQVHEVNRVKEELLFTEQGVILDSLFGTGFRGTVREPFASVIRIANKSPLPKIAIDIPSGLNGETGIVEGEAIHATETIFLGLPKTGFFLQDGWDHVGKLRYVDFGLPKQYIEESEADLIMLSPDIMKPLLPPIIRSRHKYQAGLVIGLGGSPGMPGAAILASLGALRSGAGLVRLLHPAGMEAELSSSPYELIKIPYGPKDAKKIIESINTASAIFVGPGIGRTSKARDILKNVLPNLKKPCVIDADALTIIGEEKIKLPENAILTPHVGEMIRLLERSAPQPSTKEFLQTCQNFSENHQVTVVLKGGPTFIFHPDEPIMVNPYGDPGMATAGSGDVLTGIIAALLAQGLRPHYAATLGAYLHGVAGEFAAEKKTPYCMIASDILDHLPEAFR